VKATSGNQFVLFQVPQKKEGSKKGNLKTQQKLKLSWMIWEGIKDIELGQQDILEDDRWKGGDAR
jgi:hypothetical protein